MGSRGGPLPRSDFQHHCELLYLKRNDATCSFIEQSGFVPSELVVATAFARGQWELRADAGTSRRRFFAEEAPVVCYEVSREVDLVGPVGCDLPDFGHINMAAGQHHGQ